MFHDVNQTVPLIMSSAMAHIASALIKTETKEAAVLYCKQLQCLLEATIALIVVGEIVIYSYCDF